MWPSACPASEAVDVVVLASNAIDKLIADGKVRAGSRVDLVKSGVAIAVRAGAAQLDISTEEAVKRAVLAAKTLSYSTGPSGVYLERCSSAGAFRADSQPHRRTAAGRAGRLARDKRQAELGFQQLSELMNLEGITVLGPLPPAIQTITTFSGGVSANCARPDEARALLDYMASSAASPIKQQHGMEAA